MSKKVFFATQKGITKSLEAMLARSRALQGFLNRNVLEMYRNFQRKRWMSENKSEGVRWERLNPDYKRRKKKKFAGYPGKGTKMLIATGTLLESVIGPGQGFIKIVTPKRLYIYTVLDYARYVNEKRSFVGLSDKSDNEIKEAIRDFIARGINKKPRGVR